MMAVNYWIEYNQLTINPHSLTAFTFMVSRRPARQNKAHQTKSKKSNGFVRIISGKFKGKKLPVTDSQGLRPTTDRVKETLFNWLMFQVHGSRVLDCFSGSGSLGFEALSREAAQLVMIEKDPAVAKQLKQNLNLLNSKDTDHNAQVIEQDCLSYLTQAQTQFDLVFVDPPFRLGLAEKTCNLLTQSDLLAEDAYIYVETESDLNAISYPENWHLLKEKTAGQVSYRLFQYQK